MEKTNFDDLKEKVKRILMTIYDPEIPVNIWELGLIYDIQITEENEVVVLMTLTAPNCPEAESLVDAVEKRVKSVYGVTNAKVIVTFDPPWDRSMLSDIAKIELGLF